MDASCLQKKKGINSMYLFEATDAQDGLQRCCNKSSSLVANAFEHDVRLLLFVSASEALIKAFKQGGCNS